MTAASRESGASAWRADVRDAALGVAIAAVFLAVALATVHLVPGVARWGCGL